MRHRTGLAGRPLPLGVDHVDGRWQDNRIDNLRLLCPNCRAVASTWCRGGGRYSPQSRSG
ncbi:hypothetical protein [Streptomyces sp. AHA2]|uniref:hypothetical protein n=1 Tax=Streptomyces sp. AHA2 TaxID=3064526 RepID=UPI003FA7BF95